MLVQSIDGKNLVRRYMVVEYSISQRSHMVFDPDGHFKNHLPIHHLLHSYHWRPLDGKHVLVVAYVPHHHLRKLDERLDVSVLPSVYSLDTIKGAMKKAEHWFAFQKCHGIGDDTVLRDVVGPFAGKYGPLFMPTQ